MQRLIYLLAAVLIIRGVYLTIYAAVQHALRIGANDPQIQLIVHDAAIRAGIAKQVTPHRLRASVASILLDAGMPLDHVQKFLRHKRIATTQIYAETSLHGLGETYLQALDRR